MLVSWAEQHLVLADEFRDGNVSASAGLQEIVSDGAANGLTCIPTAGMLAAPIQRGE